MASRSARPSNLTYPCYWKYPDNRGEWRWVYYASNGEEIAVSSEGYVHEADCQRGIDIMKASSNSTVYRSSS